MDEKSSWGMKLLGPKIHNTPGLFTNTGSSSSSSWYATNQFLFEVIFHNKMRKYECLTNDSSLANAIFVPCYAGLDVSQFLWVSNIRPPGDSYTRRSIFDSMLAGCVLFHSPKTTSQKKLSSSMPTSA
ncbi:unnamed protein product [Lupinus luteus]|uniref:Exostosin GT47 domain-containing protein n=1 Tax=Lupinus luteus TaxID=3873 RepID=A0AAV1VX37_LUPLU